jgi:hypothetical protein
MDARSGKAHVFGQTSDPSPPGHFIWIIGETKHNLTFPSGLFDHLWPHLSLPSGWLP